MLGVISCVTFVASLGKCPARLLARKSVRGINPATGAEDWRPRGSVQAGKSVSHKTGQDAVIETLQLV